MSVLFIIFRLGVDEEEMSSSVDTSDDSDAEEAASKVQLKKPAPETCKEAAKGAAVELPEVCEGASTKVDKASAAVSAKTSNAKDSSSDSEEDDAVAARA